MDERTGRHLIIVGRVQGVGFRYALCREALDLGLGGWVRNLVDGEVEAAVFGPTDAVDALVAWARRGPALARVARVRETPREAGEGDDVPFEVRSTARHAEQ